MTLRVSTGLRDEVMKIGGQSMADAMLDGVLKIYSGSQPADADSAETGSLLCEITLAGGAFVSGVATNGISMGQISEGVLLKAAGEVWSGIAIAAGTAGWYRFYANTVVTGASTTGIRFDGRIAVSGSELDMTNTAIVIDGNTTIDSFSLTLPTL